MVGHHAQSLSQSNELSTSDDGAFNGGSGDECGDDDDNDDEDGEDFGDEEDYDDYFPGYEDEYNDDDDDEDARDYDVEEHEQLIPGDPQKVVDLRVAVCKEDEEFGSWLENIHVRCTHEGKTIGHALGRYICREQIRSNFWRDMEEPSQDMADIAFGLFDRYGCLKAKFKNQSVQKGTGVWGEELDYGLLLFIERVEITDREWRRNGLGKAMITLLIQKAEKKSKPEPMTPTTAKFREIFYGTENLDKYSALHTVVLPGWLRSDVEAETVGKCPQQTRAIYQRALLSAVAFYRSLGFRRIGASDFLGFSSDSKHKSHTIAIADDFDLPLKSPEPELSGDDDDENDSWFGSQRREQKKLEFLKQKLPLHHAALTLTDSECLEFYRATASQDETSWIQVDHLQNNVLHVVACQVKPLTTKWLIENFDAGNGLSYARNREGYTPFEALQEYLEIGRTKMEVNLLTIDRSDSFTGFAPEAVDCLSLLKGPNTQGISTADRQRLTFGCTCGECLEGFMSPRMKLALLFQAETSHDMLDMDIDDGETWCMMHDDMLEHVELGLRRNMVTNKSYRKGFANIFAHVAACLRSGIIPRQVSVLQEFLDGPSEWPPVTRNYLERGGTMDGKIEPVLRIIFDHAQNQDEMAGDGEFERTMSEDVSKLRACRNDHEFGFVAVACGLPKRGYY